MENLILSWIARVAAEEELDLAKQSTLRRFVIDESSSYLAKNPDVTQFDIVNFLEKNFRADARYIAAKTMIHFPARAGMDVSA
jgi:hypothetical protein